MPPRLSSTRGRVGAAKSSTSAIGTSGAPCPPAATSRARKLLTTRTPNRSARTAGSPSCQVTARRLVPDRLAVEGDEGQLRRRHLRLRQHASRPPPPPTRPGARAAARASARRRRSSACAELGPLVVGVGAGDEVEQLGVGRAVEPDQRRVHAVERGARHQADRRASGARSCGAHRRRIADDGAEPARVLREQPLGLVAARPRGAPSRWRS